MEVIATVVKLARSRMPCRRRLIRLHLQAGFSISGRLAVLLTFLLARVFAGDLLRFEPEQAERERPAAAGTRSASR